MLPPDSVVRAARRWLSLLRSGTLSNAALLIQSDANYTDLTATQYASALEWLQAIGAAVPGPGGLVLTPALRQLPEVMARQSIFESALSVSPPAWLADADVLVPNADALPQDADVLAAALDLSADDALRSVLRVQSRVDLAARARIGAAGEQALVALLEDQWPGSTVHVAATDDSAGYDILLEARGSEWHLEVKSTARRGKLVVYLSRHEHEVARADPRWRLVVVGLNSQLDAAALATVRYQQLAERTPSDKCPDSRWQSVAHRLQRPDLEPGLSFLGLRAPSHATATEQLLTCGRSATDSFDWLPPVNL